MPVNNFSVKAKVNKSCANVCDTKISAANPAVCVPGELLKASEE